MRAHATGPLIHDEADIRAGTDGRLYAFLWMQHQTPTALERAFELAETRACATIEELKQVLRAEGFSTQHIVGPALTKQLRNLMRDRGKSS